MLLSLVSITPFSFLCCFHECKCLWSKFKSLFSCILFSYLYCWCAVTRFFWKQTRNFTRMGIFPFPFLHCTLLRNKGKRGRHLLVYLITVYVSPSPSHPFVVLQCQCFKTWTGFSSVLMKSLLMINLWLLDIFSLPVIELYNLSTVRFPVNNHQIILIPQDAIKSFKEMESWQWVGNVWHSVQNSCFLLHDQN